MTVARYRPPQRAASLAPALLRLGAGAALGPDDRAIVSGLGDWRGDPPGTDLGREAGVRLITQGWAARIRWLEGGRRQIFNFLLVGDFVGLGPQPGVVTLALTGVQTVSAAPLVAAQDPGGVDSGLGQVLSSARAREAGLILDQVVRLGRLSAYDRVADLLLELLRRAQGAGLVDQGRTPFPLTQEILADATGLSLVHINRVLQRLRTERLLDLRQGHLIVPDPDRLAARLKAPAAACD